MPSREEMLVIVKNEHCLWNFGDDVWDKLPDDLLKKAYEFCTDPNVCDKVADEFENELWDCLSKIQSGEFRPQLSGTKYDEDKPYFACIPGDALTEVAKVFTYGMKKYGWKNWEGGFKWSRVFSALQRHAWAWWQGEDNDPETGINHLAHLICNALMLLAFQLRNTGEDDR